MAKKTTGNKSQAILEYKSSNPDAKPKAIAEALQAAGHDINAGYVSTILSKSRNAKGGGTKRGRKKSTKGVSASRAVQTKKKGRQTSGGGASSEVSVDVLMQIRDMVSTAGGVEEVQKALNTYQKLMDN